MGYKCKKSKQEIIDTVVKHFLQVNADYDNAVKNKWSPMLLERNQGRCVAMFDLVRDLGITEE